MALRANGFRQYPQELHFFLKTSAFVYKQRSVYCTQLVCAFAVWQHFTMDIYYFWHCTSFLGHSQRLQTDLWENATPTQVDFCIILSANREREGRRERRGTGGVRPVLNHVQLCRLPRWRGHFFYQGLPARLVWQFNPLPIYKHRESESEREWA